MSISSLLFIGACYGMYRLGAFNARHPGRMLEWTRQVWKWLQQ